MGCTYRLSPLPIPEEQQSYLKIIKGVIMEDRDYDYAIGKLTRLRVWLKPSFRDKVDELIDELVDESEEL